ncbi:hypothetical protein AB0M46_23600 [Dactylosporangium sp. NPDC051485]|uniref:hypothetical protein n=1 Tax=Dactylosporangium sp. NPDC051485 TaxID=3154846 RepID=UPI003429F28D
MVDGKTCGGFAQASGQQVVCLQGVAVLVQQGGKVGGDVQGVDVSAALVAVRLGVRGVEVPPDAGGPVVEGGAGAASVAAGRCERRESRRAGQRAQCVGEVGGEARR